MSIDSINNQSVKTNDSINKNEYFEQIKYSEVLINKPNEVWQYNENRSILSMYFEKINLNEFLREIFPEGTLSRIGVKEDKKANIIVVSNTNKFNDNENRNYMKSFLIFDELNNISFFKDSEFSIMVPATFVGKRRINKNIRNLWSLTFDLDDVTPSNLENLIYMINVGLVPKPTIISNSGHGLHLYYIFRYPIKYNEQNRWYLTKFKHAITDILWNKYTSSNSKTQYQSVTQAYRLPESSSKLGKNFPVEAYLVGEKITLQYLNEFILEHASVLRIFHEGQNFDYRESNKSNLQVSHFKRNNSLDLYEKKVSRIMTKYDISGLEDKDYSNYKFYNESKSIIKLPISNGNFEGVKKRRTNPKVYEWWLKRIKNEATVGTRYNCISMLAVYAVKCGIEYEKLIEDAFSLLKPFNEIEGANNDPFSEKDLKIALQMYNKKFMKVSLDTIELKCHISIDRNIRNGRTRKDHLKEARTILYKKYSDNGNKWWFSNGRKSMSSKVLDYIKANPGKTPTQYAFDLNISRVTVYKYMKRM